MKTRMGDMTQGNILRQLVIFALPILVGSLLQQLYNAIDAIIVGRVVGPNALGAVGSTGPLVQLLISFFMGMSSGASVMISRYFGANDNEHLSKAVHTSILLAVIVGVATSVIGVALSPMILQWMGTPPEMLQDATTYLQIFFAGMLGLALYNMGSSVLQAVGNSRYPLYFLAITTVLNTIGDIILTDWLKMGVAGAAWATIFAEAISAALVLLALCRTKYAYKLNLLKLKLDRQITKSILSLGLPGALQGAIVSVSNVLVQYYMNGLGNIAVAGYSAANKLDAFIMLPIQALALAITTFVSQNLGAGDVNRARRGTRIAMIIGVASTIVLSLPAMLFHEGLLGIFSSESDVLRDGWEFMRVFAPFYFVLAGTQILPGALRGAGDVKVATFTSISCFVILRQIYLFIITKTQYNIFTVSLGYPATWTLCASIMLIHYLRSNWSSFEHTQEKLQQS